MRFNYVRKNKEKSNRENTWRQKMKIRVDLHKKEIRALMTCLYGIDKEKLGRRQKIILDKINTEKLYIKLSNILFENTFPGNI